MLSPLRYPGGKSNFVDIVERIIRLSGIEGFPFCEPFAGSAAISLGLLKSGAIRHTIILEKDPLLYAFWKCLFERSEKFIECFNALPITLKTWHDLQPMLKVTEVNNSNLLELGIAGLFFNRANFSGILHGGPIGGKEQKSEYKIHCRTNKSELVTRLEEVAKLSSKVSVEYGDAIGLIKRLKRRKRIVFYIDPPYFEKGQKLYRYYYRLSDHKKLAEVLKTVNFPWILSYDAHHVIEHLYEDFDIRRHKFQYSVKSPKNHDELLIANFQLPRNIHWK